MRVIGGSSRSIRLAGPSSEGTRPLSDRARESLFNILGQSVVDAFLVDLFAGTGAVGVEALSRGAARVTFVERDRVALDDISENIRRVHGESQALIERGDVLSYLRRPVSPPADIVFSGPPQWDDLWSTTLEAIDAAPDFLAEDGVVVTQLDPREDGADPPLEHLRRADERTYGRIRLLFHRPVASRS